MFQKVTVAHRIVEGGGVNPGTVGTFRNKKEEKKEENENLDDGGGGGE